MGDRIGFLAVDRGRVGTGLQFGFSLSVITKPTFLLINLKANVCTRIIFLTKIIQSSIMKFLQLKCL